MTAGNQVVLDACVLVNAPLRDTLLRIAEPPRLYLPRWTDAILDEMKRTLESKLGLSREQTMRLVGQLREHFSSCWVEGYEPLIPAMTNDAKDRHVLAAAVSTGAQTIVTFNLRHFPEAVLAPWNVEAQSPDDFLVYHYHQNPALIRTKLLEQSEQRGGLDRLLTIYEKIVPVFAQLSRQALDL